MLSFSETSSTAHNKISIYLYPYYFLRFQEKNPGIDESIYVSNLTIGSYTTHTHRHNFSKLESKGDGALVSSR